MTDDEIWTALREARLKFSPASTEKGTYTVRENVRAAARAEVDQFVKGLRGDRVVINGVECYRIPATVDWGAKP